MSVYILWCRILNVDSIVDIYKSPVTAMEWEKRMSAKAVEIEKTMGLKPSYFIEQRMVVTD